LEKKGNKKEKIKVIEEKGRYKEENQIYPVEKVGFV
jgi:hypothetical protein